MPNVSDIRVIPNAYTCSCDGGIKCHKGGSHPCYQALLVRGYPEEKSFYDQQLDNATKAVNAILQNVKDQYYDREQAIIASPDGLFLVWVSEGDEDDVLRGILRTEPLPAKEKT